MTRGRLPQRAGSPSLNGGGAAAAVPPRQTDRKRNVTEIERSSVCSRNKTTAKDTKQTVEVLFASHEWAWGRATAEIEFGAY